MPNEPYIECVRVVYPPGATMPEGTCDGCDNHHAQGVIDGKFKPLLKIIVSGVTNRLCRECLKKVMSSATWFMLHGLEESETRPTPPKPGSTGNFSTL